MKRFKTLLLLLVILAACATDEENIIFYDGFEAGGWNAANNSGDSTGIVKDAPLWKQSQMQGPQSGIAVNNPVRSGKYALKFEWQAALYSGSNTSKKAHLNYFSPDTSILERWYGFSVYFPSDGMETDSMPEIFAQWHARPDFEEGEGWHGCGPVANLKIQNDTISASWHGTSKRVLCSCRSKQPGCGYDQLERGGKILGPVPKNQWVDFVLYFDFNPFGGGAMVVWMNGDKVVDEQNIAVGYNDSEGPYLCIGIYKYTGHSEHEKRILYFDEVRIGNELASYKDVLPR